MKIFTIILFFMVAFYGNSQTINKKYTNEKGRFKIAFPDNPKEAEEILKIGSGVIKKYSFSSYPKNNNNLVYQLNYLDLPRTATDTLQSENIYLLLDDLRILALDSAEYKNLHIFNLELLGYLGREYRMQRDDNQEFVRVRVYLVDNRAYILYVTTPKENSLNKGIHEFLESFEIINIIFNPKATSNQKTEFSKSFKISFPKTPQKKETEALSKQGINKVVLYFFQANFVNDQNFLYGALENKFPFDVTKSKDFNLKKFYDGCIDEVLNERQSKLIYKKTVYVDGIEAIESKESIRNGQAIIKQRILLVGDTQYIIQVLTKPENDENPEMNKFIESFRLTKK